MGSADLLQDALPVPVSGWDWSAAKLSPEDGYVLSRIDGRTKLSELAALTSLPAERLEAIVLKLLAAGCIQIPSVNPKSSESEETPPPQAMVEDEMAFAEACRHARPDAVLGWLESGAMTPAKARLVAEHHPSSVGLDTLCSRAAFLQDEAFLHHLLRNAALTEATFRKALGSKPLPVVHRWALSKEISEKNRRFANALLRQRFTRAEGEEQASIVVQTEGRILSLLVGAPLNARGAAALCGRPVGSTLLIQNLARWPSTPPNVLAHLLRQPVLKSHPELKRLLQRHPNASSADREGAR